MKIPLIPILRPATAWHLASICSFAFACLAPAAAELVVTNLDDSGKGSLRAAIDASNASPEPDLILFDAVASSGRIRLQSPLPPIVGSVEIAGPGADQLTVSGDSDGDGTPDTPILRIVGPDADVKLSGLTLASGLAASGKWDDEADADDGKDDESGDDKPEAGQDTRESTALDRAGRGGALTVAHGAKASLFKLAIVDCLGRHGDQGFPAGVAIAVYLADLDIDSCLIAGNRIGSRRVDSSDSAESDESEGDGDDEDAGTSVGAGSAIYLAGSYRNAVTIRNSTISGNRTNSHSNGNAHSGAIYVSQKSSGESGSDADADLDADGAFGDEWRFHVSLTNTTVADNSTARGCAGLVLKNHRALVLLKNNVFARNAVEDEDSNCNFRQRGGHPHDGARSLGGNIFDDASGNHFLTAPHDLTEDSSLELAALAQNGGPTATHAIGAGSSAIGNAVEGAPALDQRCLARNAPADSGAYEFGAGGEPVNTPPLVSAPIADIEVNFGAPDRSFSVHPNFSDQQDADSELSYAVTANSDGSVVTTSVIASADGLLTLSFVGLGVSEVEVTATDSGGLSASTSFMVTVGDTEKPSISGVRDDISVPTDPGTATAVVTWVGPTASDNVGVTSFTSSHQPGDAFPLGSTTVSYTAADAAGNVCVVSFTIAVGDTEKPVISGVPGDLVTPTDAGAATATVSWTAPTASDNIGVTAFTSSHAPGEAFPLGITTVSYSASDAAGNTCVLSFTVTVNDTEKPTIAGLPDDILVEAEFGMTSAAVTWEPPTAADNVPGVTLTSNYSPGDEFPIGETIVIYTATDVAGNTCLAGFLVTVEEAEGGFFLDFISVRTDPAPGTDGATFLLYQHAFINENDLVVFEGAVTGGASGATNNVGVWVGDTDAVEIVAREGGPAAGFAGLEYGLFTGINLSDADEVSFNNQLRGPGVTTTTDVGHFAATGAAPLANKVREGDPAPGTGSGVFKIIQPPVAGSGLSATPAHLDIVAPITGSSDTGIWSTHSGTLQMVAWEGSPASAVPGASYGQISPSINMNEDGALAFQAFLAGAGAGSSAVLTGQPGSLTLAFQKSTTAPGTGGGLFSNFQSTAIGGSGHVAVRASLFNSVALGIGAANNDGIWANIDGTASLVAREGDQVPDLPAGVVFESFKEISIAADGSVCFSGFVSGTGVGSANDGGLWSNASGSLKTLVREGDSAPGTDGALIKSIDRFACNNNATVGLIAQLVADIGDAAPGTTQGLWLSNPETGELDLALRTGDSFDFAPGDTRVITLMNMDKSTNVTGGGGGSGRVLNNSDHLAVILEFQLGSGVFVAGRVTP